MSSLLYSISHSSIHLIDNEDWKELKSQLSKEQKESIAFKPDERGDPWGFFWTWGFLILILFGFWFLMRRMTGGGGPGGQIFNIGKSKAALFDAENKVKITFADVAGLEEAKEEWEEEVKTKKYPVDEEDVAEVVAMMTGVPVNRIAQKESATQLQLNQMLLAKENSKEEESTEEEDSISNQALY